jgi:hypothetical protein
LISHLDLGSVSDERAANGGSEGGRKKGEDKQPDQFFIPILILAGVCGKLLRVGHGLHSARGNFTQSPSNIGGVVSPVENQSGVAERSWL